jgi:hypothetical protein
MSGIRILGLCIGISGLIFTFLYFRGIRWKRGNFILFFLFNTILIVISATPDILNIFRDMLALKHSERGRILTLLIFSVIFLIFIVFYLKSKLDFHLFQFDNVVRTLGRQVVLSKEIKERIKPVMILIPAYNEANNLEKLVPKLPSKIESREIGTLIVDDGSTDGTEKITKPLNCLLVRNIINRGGGAALRLGYDVLLNHSVDVCVTMDADNQHRPEDIPKLLYPLLNGDSDIVIGSRVLGKTLSKNKIRDTGLKIFNFIISRLLKQKITDCSSGFRAFKMEVIKGIHLRENQYHTSELIIEAVKKGYRIKEVPITILRRKFGQTKKGTDFKYGMTFAKVILKTWLR